MVWNFFLAIFHSMEICEKTGDSEMEEVRGHVAGLRVRVPEAFSGT